MDFNIYKNSLKPEELDVEFLVRGMSSAQVGIERSLLDVFSKETKNAALKPKLTHATEVPEDELMLIHQKAINIDEILDSMDENASRIERWTLLIQSTHWRDRAQRLGNSYKDLAGIQILTGSLDRLTRAIKRDLQRMEESPVVTPSDNHKASTSQSQTRSGLISHQATEFSSAKTNSSDTDLETMLERTSSRKLDELSRHLLDKLSISRHRRETSKPNSKCERPRKTDRPHQDSDSDSVTDQSSRSVNRSETGHRRHVPKRRIPQYRRRLSDPSRWKISFTGRDSKRGEENVQDFVMKLEEHAYQDGIPTDELVTLMRNFVTDKADKFYYTFVRKNKDASWRQLKDALLERFSSVEGDREMRRYIRGRIQYPKETFNDFLTEIESTNYRLKHPLPVEDILEILLDNMNPALKNATTNMNINSIEKLRRTCDNYEKNLEHI